MTDEFRETLYTVDKHGRRKWVYPNLVKGFWFHRRAIIAYVLIAIYISMPWITINGKQGVWLDFVNHKFIFFGTTFWATDTIFLFLILATLAVCLFFFTALFGRVWCGWACPETVFLEFVFRPLERLIEGNSAQRKRLDQQPWNLSKIQKKFLKHGVCAALAWIIATTAIAYVVGADPLIRMISEGPHHHPLAFSMTLIGMGLMAFQFGWFREQFCTILCPYARFQSVMMDANSLVVGYDPGRGEPRCKLRKNNADSEKGDCVDCGLCVRVCPTGIDIRNGLQMECIACTACVDACDSIMVQIGRPQGLIRYDTENRLFGKSTTILRPRVFVYLGILAVFFVAFGTLLSGRELSEFQVVRGAVDKAFVLLDDGRVSNHLHVRLGNKSDEGREYTVQVIDEGFESITPLKPFPVPAGKVLTAPLFINFTQEQLRSGKRKVTVVVWDNFGYEDTQEITLLGPEK